MCSVATWYIACSVVCKALQSTLDIEIIQTTVYSMIMYRYDSIYTLATV